MTKKKSGAPRPQGKAKTLPGKTEGGFIAAKLKDAGSFGKKTDKIMIVTPFEHAPGTV